MTTLLDLIDEADLIEIDGHSIRYFGLSEDEMMEAEDGDEDACVLSVEMVDESYEKYEWYFSYKELKEAKRKDNGSWIVDYMSDGYPLLVTVYKLEQL